MNVIALTGWDRFQHYKDRDPPWVKLYRDILTSESWVLGSDTSRLVQVASILLAARYNNQIPHRWDLIRKVACLECSEKQFNEAIKHLATNHFLAIQQVTNGVEVVAQDASSVLAKCSSETESEQSREETEQIEIGARASRSAQATRLPSDFELTPQRRAVAEIEKADPDREFAQFTDHFRAASGAKARKCDWDAAWRNWCRRAPDFKPRTRFGNPDDTGWRPPPDDPKYAGTR